LPKIGYKKRIHFMNPLIPGLTKTGKMSSSEPDSKINFDDTNEMITERIQKAYSEDGVVEGNGLMALLRYIIFRKLEVEKREFKITRPEKWGGDISYSNYADLEIDFLSKKLSSVDLKPALIDELIIVISPIREVLRNNQELLSKAYPEV